VSAERFSEDDSGSAFPAGEFYY